MASIMRRALGGVAMVTLLAAPVAAQDWKASLKRLVAEARTFESPGAAIHRWGDPRTIEGSVMPLLSFHHRFPTHTVWVQLQFRQPAAAPERLETIELIVEPSPSETTLTAWFGTPARVLNDRTRGRELTYTAHDAAHLGVLAVWPTGASDERAVIRVTPYP